MVRTIRIGALLLAAACGLSGCLLNSPSNVTKRFVGAIKSLNWDKMERIVDWEASEQALRRPLGENRKELLTKVAERITDYGIGREGEERSRTKLLYLKVTKTKITEKTDDRATVTATISMGDPNPTEVVFTTTKVGRTWRVVLTPNLLRQGT
ncbi:MAG: hypothetical protein JW889_13150 [Verrucomicrobia bacterium]|nr:hypothetical protein [Verrucomicrobiota bacterium]